MNLSRRNLLRGGSALAVWPFLNLPFAEAASRRVFLQDYPFQLGVASGDPVPDGVVLWTRLAPDPLHGGGMPAEDVAVRWEVAKDENFSRVLRHGEATATADWGHSVHVEVSGLRPDHVYWYRFMVGSEVSPTGRTRTAPLGHKELSRLRFAFASCQNYEQGLFTAYKYMAAEDLNAVVHLGDYIYEGRANDNRVRKHNSAEIQTLEDYRNRHALYKSDLDLQAAHAAFPWIVTWDDHEFDNNYASEISEQPNVVVEEFLRRRAAAYQAYYEHMPLRRSSLPHGPMMKLYRKVSYGRLAQFSVLDTRQYRTDQPNGDGNKPPSEEQQDPSATILGKVQEKWLCDTLVDSASRWNVMAQQVMMGPIDREAGEGAKFSMDQWAGYPVGRDRFLRFLHERKISNPVVITGDVHSNWVNDLKLDFDDENAPVVATEVVGTSISSGGNGVKKPKNYDATMSENPWVQFHNAQRGYVRCELTPESWQTDFRIVPKVTELDSPIGTASSFVLESGSTSAKPA
ncbi:MAG: alkaline phosphatase D family protein [Planctomycetota bacterium]